MGKEKTIEKVTIKNYNEIYSGYPTGRYWGRSDAELVAWGLGKRRRKKEENLERCLLFLSANALLKKFKIKDFYREAAKGHIELKVLKHFLKEYEAGFRKAFEREYESGSKKADLDLYLDELKNQEREK